MAPVIGTEDGFEALYTEKFRVLVRQHGEFVCYERDRAAVDIGLHLAEQERGQRRVSRTRIWFQLKGLHAATLSSATFDAAEHVAVRVRLDHLKFWFASPEPIYLATYVEAADLFLVEDVQDLVYRQWGADFLAPQTFRPDQQDVTIHMATANVLTPERLMLMRRHQSMRIDGPFFRGRPLGHRLDPLRSVLDELEPDVFTAIVLRLLAAHDYRHDSSIAPEALFGHNISADDAIQASRGRLFHTYEWVPFLFNEIGIGKGDDFRIEGNPEFAQGPVAVCIHSRIATRPDRMALRTFAADATTRGISRLLAFANTDDYAYLGSFFGNLRDTGLCCLPQLLPDLAFSLLTTTAVYLEFRDAVSWKYTNYLR